MLVNIGGLNPRGMQSSSQVQNGGVFFFHDDTYTYYKKDYRVQFKQCAKKLPRMIRKYSISSHQLFEVRVKYNTSIIMPI